MVFYVVRIIICASIYFLINKMTKHWRQNDKRARELSIVLSVIACLVLFFTPFENAFYTFSSCESAYLYNHTSPIETIINGTETDMVIGKKDMAILPKDEAGWKICVGSNINNTARIIHEDTIALFYRYKESPDCFLVVYDSLGTPLSVSDNRQSIFQEVAEYQPRLDDSSYTYYTCIHDPDEGYTLTVDDQNISLSEALN